jgi:hydrogenase maturation protease
MQAASKPTSVERTERKTLVLGLGNDVLTDDAIGLKIASALSEDPAIATSGIVIKQTTEMGLALLDFVAGYDRLIIIDSILTGKAPPGHLHVLQNADIAAIPTLSPHFLGVGEMLALGAQLGLHMPAQVTIFAVEVADPYTVGVNLSPDLQKELPRLIEEIRELLR